MSEQMNELNLSPELLNLPDIKLLFSEIDRKGDVIIKVESTVDKIPCRTCGKATNPYGKSYSYRVRHLPIFGRKTYIEITPRRGRCYHCDDNPTTTEQPCWHERKSKHTKAYEKHVLLSLIHSTMTDVSIKEDVSYGSVQGIVDRYVAINVDWSKVTELGLVGIDEISLKKGHRDFVTVITSRIDEITTIIGVIKGREKVIVRQFFEKIPKRLRRTIIAICTDMYAGYVGAAKEVFGSDIPIVVDRFHVAQLYRRCFVTLRKAELARLRKTLTSEQYKGLQPAIAILCRNTPFVTSDEKKILKPLFKISPSLKIAHKLCCKLTAIYNSYIGSKRADSKINEWLDIVTQSGLTCFKTFVKTLQKYKTEILNYFKGRHTSGFVEGINNKLKVLKRRCYGICNINSFFQRAFLDISGYVFLRHNTQLEAI